jgi:ribose transport system substrate-binding protein
MINRRDALYTLLLAPVLASCEKKKQPEPYVAPPPLKIAVIPGGTTRELWTAVHAGVAKAKKDVGGQIDLLWQGPPQEGDVKAQVAIVESMVAQHVSGILLAPLDEKALAAPVKAAMDAKIPVVVFESALAGEGYTSFVGSDSRGVGVKAGSLLAKALGNKGHVLVFRYQEGATVTTHREDGFANMLRGTAPDIAILSDKPYGGPAVEAARAAAEAALSANKAADGGVNGVFCSSESTTLGMLLALEQSNLAGKVKLVGYGAEEKLIQGLRDGHVEGLVVEDGLHMGDTAMRVLVRALRGQTPSKANDSPVSVLVKDDLDKPETQELLHTDLKKWLGE